MRTLVSSNELVSVYRDGDLAIKVFNNNVPKTLVFYEALTQARIEETGLNVPCVRDVSLIDSKWEIHSDWIEGKTLKELMEENPQNIDEYINIMVDLQLSIHAKKQPRLNKLKDIMHERIQTASCIDDIKRFELLTRLDVIKKHNKLCHGNFSPENIIINEKGTFIVDWIEASQGNASADVSNTYLILSLMDPAIAYKYLSLFCEKTNTSKKYVQEWLPLVAAARLSKGIDAEKELLSGWIDVVDYV